MTGTELKVLLQNEYISKILGFSYVKTNDRVQAEDLTQDICVELIKAINSGKDIENFNAFVWKVCNSIFCKWLTKHKKFNKVYLTENIVSEDNVEEFYAKKEELAILKREIALLSKNYRETIVLHYFYGKSCEEISVIKNRSIGTVKWWLYDARKFIKEGMCKMREFGEKSYNPSNLFLSCQGNPGVNFEPMSCVKRKSTQNILLAAYKNPISIEELSLELGIASPYIEDEVNSLIKNQLIREISKGNYQTDFIILPEDNLKLVDKIFQETSKEYYNELICFLNEHKEVLESKKFNIAGFKWNRLLWVYIHLITTINTCEFSREVCKKIKYDDMPDRDNGGKWIALGFENKSLSTIDKDVKEYYYCDGPVNKNIEECVQGFFHYYSGIDSSMFFNLPDGIFKLCREIIKGNIKLEDLNEEEKLLFSIAVEKELFIKENDTFKLNFYYVDREQMVEINKLASKFKSIAYKSFNKAYKIVLDEYKVTIPKHLKCQMGNFLSNHLNLFVTTALCLAYNDGLLSEPKEGKAWLSLFATEGIE